MTIMCILVRVFCNVRKMREIIRILACTIYITNVMLTNCTLKIWKFKQLNFFRKKNKRFPIHTWVLGSINWTPRYEIKIKTARLVLWFAVVGNDPGALLIAFTPMIFSFFFNFWIDFFVDSVPRNSFITVDPRYY